MRRTVCVVCVLSILCCSSYAEEQANENSLPDLKNIIVAGPYCGIYSLNACLEAFGKKIETKELLTPD